jgi:hypothetical protein
MWTHMRDGIWNTERGCCLLETGLHLQAGTSSYSSSPAHSIEILPQLIYCWCEVMVRMYE